MADANIAAGTASGWYLILTGATLRYIWRIPLTVGTFLSVVNQSSHVMAGPSMSMFISVVVNYLTPYVVSSLGFIASQKSDVQLAVDRN